MAESVDPVFSGVVQLAGWSENHSQGCRVTFWLESDSDLESFRRLTLRRGKVAGQLLAMVLVEVDDNGETVNQPKRHVSSDMHLMVTGPQFLAYVQATQPSRLPWDSERCKRWAKNQIGIDSLSELDTDPLKLKRFRDIVQRPFAEWNEENGTGQDRSNDGAAVPLDEDTLEGD